MPAILAILAPLFTPILNAVTKGLAWLAAYRAGRNRQEVVDNNAIQKNNQVAQRAAETLETNMQNAGDGSPKNMADFIALGKENKL